MIYVVDEIASVVEKTSQKLQSVLGKEVNYLYGHPLEIVNQLTLMTQSKNQGVKKYPLIGLFQDFREIKGERHGIESKVNLHLIIANGTQPNYTAPERYQHNFKPVLYPIYEEFLNQLFRHRQFTFPERERISHTKIDRLYWGKEGLYGNAGNIFNDYLDCIEIQNLQLLVKTKTCLTNGNIK